MTTTINRVQIHSAETLPIPNLSKLEDSQAPIKSFTGPATGKIWELQIVNFVVFIGPATDKILDCAKSAQEASVKLVVVPHQHGGKQGAEDCIRSNGANKVHRALQEALMCLLHKSA